MTEAELQALDDPDAPNTPAALPNHPGSIEPVSEIEQRQRREAMTAMLAQGVSRDAITITFGTKFGMTERGVRALIEEVRAMWDDEDADAARYYKSGQLRRMHRHIQEAAKDRKWTAVANLEKVFADVAGTNTKEEEQPIDVDSRLNDALLSVLGAKDTQQVRILVERERMRIELDVDDELPQRLPAGRTIAEAPQGGGG